MRFSNKRFCPSSLKRNSLETLKNLKRELEHSSAFVCGTEEHLLYMRVSENPSPCGRG